MAISKINFTAEPNLLNRMQDLKSAVPSAPVNQAPVEAPVETPAKKSNKVRNWSIGMGSAAVLIGLGVLGHNGKLGKTMQKICGGAKKNADDVVDELGNKLDDVLAGGERKAGGATDDITPEVFGPETRTADEVTEAAERTAAGQAVKKGFPEIAKTAEDVTPEYIARVNASIDRTLPNLDDISAKIEIPELNPALKKELESIDASVVEKQGYIFKLPNGNERHINLLDGKVSAVFDYNSNGERVLYAPYCDGLLYGVEHGNIGYSLRNGQITQFTQRLGSRELTYNENGQLHYIEELSAGGNRERTIFVDDGTKNIRRIFYNTPTQKNIKIDHFIDGKLAVEEFTDGSYKTLKEIRHDLSK